MAVIRKLSASADVGCGFVYSEIPFYRSFYAAFSLTGLAVML
ncbi:MAG: hypothetical protein P8H31_04840 [Porticoccaceae bacterium]|nr:hypothetical protein [Porticoccaceae bacterium]